MWNYTTVEQSKKMVELGFKPESADMIHWRRPGDEEYVTDNLIWLDCINRLRRRKFISYEEGYDVDVIPCWTVGALEGMIIKRFPDTDLVYDREKDKYWVCFGDGDETAYDTDYYDSIIDAWFEMVCFLKQDGKLKID